MSVCQSVCLSNCLPGDTFPFSVANSQTAPSTKNPIGSGECLMHPNRLPLKGIVFFFLFYLSVPTAFKWYRLPTNCNRACLSASSLSKRMRYFLVQFFPFPHLSLLRIVKNQFNRFLSKSLSYFSNNMHGGGGGGGGRH